MIAIQGMMAMIGTSFSHFRAEHFSISYSNKTLIIEIESLFSLTHFLVVQPAIHW